MRGLVDDALVVWRHIDDGLAGEAELDLVRIVAVTILGVDPVMFLLAGVFTWPSLRMKGTGAFLRDRAMRIGVPFVLSVLVLAPLAYIPAWMITPRTSSFMQQWLALGEWPAGPAWFLWVLLAFALVTAGVMRIAPRSGRVLESVTTALSKRPIVYFLALTGASALVYLPMAAAVDPTHWTTAGPFYVQTSRIVHYLLYFMAGMGLGVAGADRGLLSAEGPLARRWPVWIAASMVSFALAIVTFLTVMSALAKGGPGIALATFGNFTFALSCAASSMAAIAVFLRFAKHAGRFAQSLMANALGIYLLHYIFVNWLQLAMRSLELGAGAKFLIVVAGSIAGSWILSSLLRRLAGTLLRPRSAGSRGSASAPDLARH